MNHESHSGVDDHVEAPNMRYLPPGAVIPREYSLEERLLSSDPAVRLDAKVEALNGRQEGIDLDAEEMNVLFLRQEDAAVAEENRRNAKMRKRGRGTGQRQGRITIEIGYDGLHDGDPLQPFIERMLKIWMVRGGGTYNDFEEYIQSDYGFSEINLTLTVNNEDFRDEHGLCSEGQDAGSAGEGKEEGEEKEGQTQIESGGFSAALGD